MVGKKIFAGARVRKTRKDQGITQSAMAQTLGISASYLNLIESNQRPLTAQVLARLANRFDLDIASLHSVREGDVFPALKQLFSDPLLAGEIPSDPELHELQGLAPNVASAMIKLYRAYRESSERLSGLSTMMARDGIEAVATTARLPIDEVREAFERNPTYFPAIERASVSLAQEIQDTSNRMSGLQKWLADTHRIEVRILPVETMPMWRRRFDRHTNRLFISERLSPADQMLEVAMEVAQLYAGKTLNEEVEFLKLTSEEAKRVARFEFARLFALAFAMPYDRILSAARQVSYDINILRSRFSVTFAQAAWRLTMLSRHGQSGVPIFVMEIDAAGNRLRKSGTKGFPLNRFGGDCPKLVVHQAFTSPGQIFAEEVITPQDARFIVAGRTVEGLRSGFEDRPQRNALLIGFDVSDAKAVVYGQGLAQTGSRKAVEIGPSCKLCERQGCIARAHPPLTKPLGLDEMVKGLSAFDFQ